ncbi:MAG: hypothetical protein K0U28_08000 [Cyanobacteria bacterium]|nr:hypothetical protein [Cyanobacteriota bacterium]
MSSDQLLTISEVAKYAGKSASAVRWNLEAKNFPHAEKVEVSPAKPGKEATYKWLIPLDDVLAVWPQAAPKEPDAAATASATVTLSIEDLIELKTAAARLVEIEADRDRLIDRIEFLEGQFPALEPAPAEAPATAEVIDLRDTPAPQKKRGRVRGWFSRTPAD